MEETPSAPEQANATAGVNLGRIKAHDPIVEEDEALMDDPEMEPADGEPAATDAPAPATEGDMDVEGEDDAIPEALEDAPLLPEEPLPTLDEYQEKWDRLYRQHTRPVKGNFNDQNLVPVPVPQLFQNCPWVLSKGHPNQGPGTLKGTWRAVKLVLKLWCVRF